MSSLLLGVDAGAANLKIIELKEKKGGYAVKNLAAVQMPPDIIVDGKVMDHAAAAKVIKDAVAGMKGAVKDASFGMRGKDVVVKRIRIPWNGKGSFQETFLWGADQYIGIKANRASFDAQVLSYDRELGMADAVVAGAHKEKVGDCLAMAQMAGLKAVVVDIEALSLVNLMTAKHGKKDHPNAIIDMGHDSTNVIFYDNGHVDFVKSIPKGCRFLMEDMASDMDVDLEKAVEIIRNKETMSNDVDAQAAAMSFGSSIGAEIETAVETYIQDRRKEPVDFFICGAGAQIPGAVEQLEIAMKLTVEQIDPFQFIELPDSFKPVAERFGKAAFAVAAGLAMRKA